MRLLTHNTLRNPAKDVAGKGFPLGLEVTSLRVVESQLNVEFVRGLLHTLEWSALMVAAAAVGLKDFPQTYNVALLGDETFLQSAHTLLLDIHVDEGFLICPDTSRRFPISKGVPDFILPEVEV
jgi:multifunctional methyltransferase subunit TRM112